MNSPNSVVIETLELSKAYKGVRALEEPVINHLGWAGYFTMKTKLQILCGIVLSLVSAVMLRLAFPLYHMGPVIGVGFAFEIGQVEGRQERPLVRRGCYQFSGFTAQLFGNLFKSE